jgi:hypothetical protein
VSFAAITLCVASQRVLFIAVSVYFIIDSVRKVLGTFSYTGLDPVNTRVVGSNPSQGMTSSVC